jgi:DNA-binding LytR/AlgR family response regulator
MDINVRTNISSEFQDIEVCINAPERNEEVQRLENELLSKQNRIIKNIMGIEDNDIFIINISDVIVFFSEEKNNFCKTKDGVYKIKEKLYYLEEVLPEKYFIRISNSAIININHVKCFNTSLIGKIIVKFKDGSEEIVSKRKTSEIMKFLKTRRD